LVKCLVMQNSSLAGHLNYLDGMRAIAACYVVAYHASLQLGLDEASVFSYIFRQVFSYGHFAVTVFIVLSGFCLMLPVTKTGELRGGPISFFKRRAHRILPPYYLAMAVSLFLIATVIGKETKTHWDASLPVTLETIIIHIFLLHDIWVEHCIKINHVFWSISVEWRIYMLFPVLLILWKKWGAMPTLILTLIVSYFAQYLLDYTPFNALPWGMCLHYTGLFVVGMLACEVSYSDKKKMALLNKLPWGIIAIVMFVLSVIVIKKLPALPFYVGDLFVAIWALCVLISLSKQTPSVSLKILTWQPLVFLGTFAYSIYLIHAPVIQLVTQYIVKPMNLNNFSTVMLIMVLGTVFSIVAAYFFYLACERPFINKRKTSSSIPTPVIEAAR
jgi:peptidoglycan/LPS O-acetylase OafA/YrhL